jgi:hypothetical protein
VGEAIEQAEQGAVAEVREILQILTAQMRKQLPSRVRKARIKGQQGQAVEKTYEPGKAASKLLDCYAPQAAQMADYSQKTLTINLSDVPRDRLREGVLGFLREAA